MGARFAEAFSSVMAHDLDRRALLSLQAVGREVRYAELRRATGERSSQLFDYAIERLIAQALLNRRLIYHGKRFQSHLSLSGRGLTIAKVLDGLVTSGRLPQGLNSEVHDDVQQVFAGAPKRLRKSTATPDSTISKANAVVKGRRLPRADDLHLDPREIEKEIARNRASNEQFLRDYSAWFERQAPAPSKKRPRA